ncbi:MAG: PorP/SprF family type IX secretion system membrane protein [Schleiferiaceae bacterium]|nr:PorP/SprF family type IX secretion system membrane protein [Schleiferiaceae bacterium]
MINLEQIQEPLQLCGKRFVLLLFVVMLGSGNLFAQDPTFSMIYLNKLFLNPAYAGINRDLNMTAQSRIQWAGLPGRMETKTAAMDVACPASKLGFGMILYDDMAGDGAYRNTNGSVMIAAHLPSKYPRNLSWKKMRNRKFIMSAALQYTVGQKSVDWSRLVFSDQLDAALGILRPVSAVQPGMEVSNLIHDISAGLLFRTELNKHGSFLSVGISSFHINQPVESFYGDETRLPTRLNVHSHANFRVSKKYTNTLPTYLTVGLVYDRQAMMQTVLTGGSLTFGKDFLLGLWYRNRRVMLPEVDMDAVIINLIYSTKSFSVGYSYDITVSALGLDRTYGTHEIGINYRFDNVYLCKKKSQRGRADRHCFLVDRKFMEQNELINFLP